MVELLNADVNSGFRRPLVAEIDKSPFSYCRRKTHINCEPYTTETKRALNFNGKPLSLYHLVTSLPVSNAPIGRNRDFVIIDQHKIR
jgi:hypothetical protein